MEWQKDLKLAASEYFSSKQKSFAKQHVKIIDMTVFIDKTFTEETIAVDDNTYRNCKFISCHIVYSGGAIPILHSNNFVGCEWIFEGPALRTLQFMSGLYKSGAKHLISQFIFDMTGEHLMNSTSDEPAEKL